MNARQDRARQRMRASGSGRARDRGALGPGELLAGAAADSWRPVEFGARGPAGRSRVAHQIAGWVAAAHLAGRTGVIAGRKDLARLLGCSPSAAARAADGLAAAGWIVRRPRSKPYLDSDSGRWRLCEQRSALEPGPALIAALSPETRAEAPASSAAAPASSVAAPASSVAAPASSAAESDDSMRLEFARLLSAWRSRPLRSSSL